LGRLVDIYYSEGRCYILLKEENFLGRRREILEETRVIIIEHSSKRRKQERD
jgi:hypothetical protein